MKKSKFVIKDWTGKVLFNGKSFNTFEDGWDYIYINVPAVDEEIFGEYYVMPTEEA